MLDEENFDDFPVKGPRTTRWLCNDIAKTGLGPVGRHHQWMRDAEIPPGDRSRFEHEVLSKILEVGVTYDQLQVGNLGSFEVASRRLQVIENAHLDNPMAPTYESSGFYMGTEDRRGGALVAPDLESGKYRRCSQGRCFP